MPVHDAFFDFYFWPSRYERITHTGFRKAPVYDTPARTGRKPYYRLSYNHIQ